MNKRRFVSILSCALFFHEGTVTKSDAVENNNIRGFKNSKDAVIVIERRTNNENDDDNSMEPISIGQKYRHDSFYDFENWNINEKRDMVKSIQVLHRTSSSIDWDEMRDKYIMQIVDDIDIDRSTLSPSSSSSSPPLSSSPNEIIKLEEKRRRLSTIDHPQERILKGKKTKKFKKKKKYKSKGSKKKNTPMIPPTATATASPTREPIVTAPPPSPSPDGGSYSSNKSKGKSKKEYKSKGKSKKKIKKKKGKVIIKKTKNGWCIVRSSVEEESKSYKKKSKKYNYDDIERGRALKKSKTYFLGNGILIGKTMKIKKKKSKGSKKSKSKSKGKGSKKSYNTPSPQNPTPSAPTPSTTTTASPTSSSYYYYHQGKGKSKKQNFKYPFCDEVETVAPDTSTSPSISTSPSQSPSSKNLGGLKTTTPSDNPRTRNPIQTPLTRQPTGTPPKATPNPTRTRITPNPTPTPTNNPTKQTPSPTSSPTTPKPTPERGIYRYDDGACPASGSLGVPCAAETNIRKICNRYDAINGSFRKCWDICRPAFCCIHDANPDSNYLAPSCSKDENCAQYAYCYIVWFKFHDTFGPATFINVEQENSVGTNFFDVSNDEVRGDKLGDEFFDQLYFHHFDDVQSVMEDGTDPNGEFDLDTIFEDPLYWDNNI